MTTPPAAPPQPAWWRRQIRLHAYLGETLFLVGLLTVLNLALMPARPGFLGIEPNPFWVPILLMVVRYGFRAGLLAALLSSAVYLALVSARVSDQVITYRDLFGWEYARSPVLFLVFGVTLGMLVQRHRTRVQRLEQANQALTLENQKLRRGEEELRDVNVELASRVAGATDTLPMLYKYAKKLNDLDLDQIYTTLTELVVEVIRAGSCAIYVEKQGRWLQHSANGQPALQPRELLLEPELVQRLVASREVLSLHQLLELGIRRQDLYLCGPLSQGAGGRVVAILAVHELEFLRYNPATVRLFSVIIDWACASLEKAARFTQHPQALRMEQAKTSILRAQRASQAPEVSPAGPQELELVPAKTSAALPRGLADLAGISVPSLGDHALSRVLGEASQRLFGEGDSTLQPGGEPVAPPELSPAELKFLLSGELQIASTHGSPLAKLLAEIDGYLAGRSGKAG